MEASGEILIIDDEPAITDFIAEALSEEGYSVRTALTAADAYIAVEESYPDLVLLDMHLLGTTGDVLAHEFKAGGLSHVPIILMTADAQAARELSKDGIEDCLMKPFDLDDLVNCVAKHLQRNRLGCPACVQL